MSGVSLIDNKLYIIVVLSYSLNLHILYYLTFIQDSRRSADDWMGRNDGNTKVIFPKTSIQCGIGGDNTKQIPQVGDYVAVKVCCIFILSSPFTEWKKSRSNYRLNESNSIL